MKTLCEKSVEAEIDQAVEALHASLVQFPQRRIDLCQLAVMRGEPRPYPVLYLGRHPDTDAGEAKPVTADPPRRTPQERLLQGIRGLTGPLAMHNPFAPLLSLGKGPGTLAASFGIFLDPKLGYTPGGSRPLDEVLKEGVPDPQASGLLAEISEDIDAARELTPSWVRIGLPDMQGPFNIAHMVLGDDAFVAPVSQPERFDAFMRIITHFYIEVHKYLCGRIGQERLPVFPRAIHRIAECSVNLVSESFYMEYILKHDLRLAAYFGRPAIHPCSGPHVFRATLRELPNVCFTEAGFIEKTAAGSILVDDALAEIGDRPMILAIGQELPEGEAEAFIRRDLDRARTNHRLLFAYTGIHWKKADDAMIRDMHLRLDEYWRTNVQPEVKQWATMQ